MQTTTMNRAALPHAPLAAIGFVLLAYCVAPMMDGTAKWLSTDLPILQIVWARYFFHLLAVLPVVLWRHGAAALWPANVGAQVLRSGFMVGSTVVFFTSIAYMPLADSIALVFVYPVIVTALSPKFLGEAVDARRWVAVGMGLAGTMIILRPGGDVLGWPALLALSAGCTFAFYMLMTRRIAGTAPPLVTLTFTAALGAILMTALMPVVWVEPEPGHWPLLIGVGILSAAGHLLLIVAYERAPAPVLAPFAYFEILGSTTVGLVVFGDFPDATTWIGITVLVAAGIYISVRERMASR